ncbi:MAG TPA: thioredoxin [Casimicrobiaceae bacterium]|jgi:putative thioredoxin|nr:thioredoxin [Casimicrobiaceae bacterium]
MTAIDVNRANFEETVLLASASRPVLVDFWAPWCAPCRALAPILDRLASEYADRFTLAKLNTDAEPEIAARYGVRGIPNCKLFVNGTVADEFTGALPESALRAFLAEALPSAAAPLVAAAKSMLPTDAAGALAKLDEALAVDPRDEDVLLTRVEALLALRRVVDARSALQALERDMPVLRDARRLATVKARLVFVDAGEADLGELSRKAATTPIDCAAKLAYARALAAAGDYEAALAEALAVVRADRTFDNDAGRRTMLMVFDALPSDSDLARRYRRELAAAVN